MRDELAVLPEDVETLKAALLAARADIARVNAEAAAVLAQQSSDQALIAHLKLQIEKLNRDRFTASVHAPSAPPGCSTRWSCSSRGWRPRRPRTNWPPRAPRPKPRMS